jgi:hypothetical protein
VDIANEKHYPLTSTDASRWTKATPEFTTVEQPSERLRAMPLRKAAEKRPRDSNVQTTTSSYGNIHKYNITGNPVKDALKIYLDIIKSSVDQQSMPKKG